MDQNHHHECGKHDLKFQVSSLENIFVSNRESTHQLNIHMQLIWLLALTLFQWLAQYSILQFMDYHHYQ